MISCKAYDNRYSLSEREKFLNSFLTFSKNPCVSINTCNRLELYWGDGNVSSEIVTHLFRLVAGLESNLIGEIAIQGQVKKAYMESCLRYKLSKGIHILFQTALSVGKRVRNESGISQGAISHSHAVIEIMRKNKVSLDKSIITLIGAHKMNEDIIKFLKVKGAETIFLANKSFEKAEIVASKFSCKVFKMDQLKNHLLFTDVLITATSAPHLIIRRSDFPEAKEMVIFDLAFPRDVEETIGDIKGVTLFNIELIEKQIDQNIEKRKGEIEIAERIIEEETQKFFKKQIQYAARVGQNNGS